MFFRVYYLNGNTKIFTLLQRYFKNVMLLSWILRYSHKQNQKRQKSFTPNEFWYLVTKMFISIGKAQFLFSSLFNFLVMLVKREIHNIIFPMIVSDIQYCSIEVQFESLLSVLSSLPTDLYYNSTSQRMYIIS